MYKTLQPRTPEEVGMSPERLRRIADLAKGWVAQGVTPALVVLAARKGVVVVHEAFGCLTPDPDSPPLKRDAVFPLASITKPITATAVMVLVEDGLLGLNRPVSWYIPEFAGEGRDAVSVHHLLTHTSGFRDEEAKMYDPSAFAEKKKGMPPPAATQHPWLHELLYVRYDVPLWKPPGTEMSYCSYGYELLGEIVRRVSGQSLADFARERIFDPLEMKDTCYIVPDSLKPRIVRRSADAPAADVFAMFKHQEMPWACGGAYATAMDIAIFGQLFLNRGVYGNTRILSQASVAEMTRNQIPGIGARYGDELFPEASWGLGWNILGNKRGYDDGTLRSTKTFQHGGDGGVYLWVDPVYEIVGVYFSVAREGQPWCSDLFMNAVTAAVAD